MKRHRRASLLVGPALVALFAVACGHPPAPARRFTVEIRGMQFQPAVLTITAGDTITWINRDIVPHTATANIAGRWDTGVIVAGDSASTVAAAGGTTAYHCSLHPVMMGEVVAR